MLTTLGVALGGALGATLRYLVGLGLEQRLGSGFPFGTLTVNLVGCLLIGLLAALFVDATEGREPLRLFLIVGCLGGFTTFSSFGLDTLRLLQDGAVAAAVGYVLASNLGGLLACWIGTRLGGGLGA